MQGGPSLPEKQARKKVLPTFLKDWQKQLRPDHPSPFLTCLFTRGSFS